MANNTDAYGLSGKPSRTRAKGAQLSAAPAGGGNTPRELVRQSNSWRDNYNPLRGLIMRRVTALFEAGERGEYADLQWLYRIVEKRFPVLRSLVVRRRSALTKLDWDVKIVSELPPGATDAQAKAQRDFLKGRYELIENLKDAIAFLALAEFRGYAHLNKHRFENGENDGAVKELHWLPQWNFVRDGQFGDWYFNQEAASGATARSLGGDARINPEDFIIREVEMPINEIGLIAFVRSNLSMKDWDAFVEMFGIPGCVVMMPPNIPAGKEDEYKNAARSVAEGASGALPSASDVKFPGAAARSNAPFKEHLDYQEKDVVLAGTGGKLTMLTGPTGLGGGQAEVHQDVFDEIATAEAGEISEVFQCQFDRPELAAEFPDQPVLCYFEISPVDKSADTTLAFKRDTFKAWLADGTVSDILANLTDLKQMVEDVKLPPNEEYIDPYVPVTDESGALVTGEVLKDTEGDVIGALPQKAEPADPGAGGALPAGQRPSGRPTGKPNEGGLVANRGGSTREIGILNPPSAKLEQKGVEELARAVSGDLRPVLERLSRLQTISDPEILKNRAEEFLRDLEKIKNDLLADPSSARVIEGLLNAGFSNGAIKNRLIMNGDVSGHEFHGNQWTEATAAEHSRLRSEAETARHAAHVTEYETPNATDAQIVAAHRDALEKYQAVIDHAKASGDAHAARIVGSRMRAQMTAHKDAVHYFTVLKKRETK